MKNIIQLFCAGVFGCLWVASIQAALPDGRLYIQNDHSFFQFECRYQINGEPMVPITIYKDKQYIGRLRDISKLELKSYGKVGGLGASWYPIESTLNKCKAYPGNNCLIKIENKALGTSWDVSVVTPYTVTTTIPRETIDYFPRAKAATTATEARYVLNLPAVYTAEDVRKRLERLNEEIQEQFASSPLTAKKLINFAEHAAQYTTAKVSPVVFEGQEKQMDIEFRGKQYPERIQSGKKIICGLLTGTRQERMKDDIYLSRIIDLIWYLYDRATTKKQAFEEGTYVIQDPGLKIYNYLMTYVKQVNPSITDTLQDPAATLSLNQYAYSRLSSHFYNEQKQFRHYGIDIRFPNTVVAQAELPAGKSHILFGKIAPDTIFIKPESFGNAPQAVFFHGSDWAAAQIRKINVTLKDYLQGTFGEALVNTLIYYIGTDDEPTYRKERIPKEFLSNALTILRSGQLNEENMKQAMQILITRGIHGARELVAGKPAILTRIQANELKQDLDRLEQEGLDHQDMRYGREVVLTRDELMAPCQ
jgi:hypothetical protein